MSNINIKTGSILLIIHALVAAVLINLMPFNVVYAFHSGGVGQCEGCHIMHNPLGITYNWLLPGTDPSSICLNCHSGAGAPDSYHIASPDGSAMSPGGDFYWLKKTFIWSGGTSQGYSHGHNIVALDFGFTADPLNTVAPGGSYLATDLGCNSCHDPHGKVSIDLPVSGSGSYGAIPVSGTILGNYRLLGGASYNGGEHVNGYLFTYDVPVAAENPAVPFGETDSSHADYGSNMSEWCANCHAGILANSHQGGTSSFQHPVGNGALFVEYVANYNSYVKTGDLSGLPATSYLALVPFERGIGNSAYLNPTSTQGPDNSSNIMCMTCHRAHASAFPYIGRWDFSAQLVADSHPGASDGGVTGNDLFYSYYGRNMLNEFGPGQRVLCEKCHPLPDNGYPPGW